MDLLIEICACFALVVWAVVILKVVWQEPPLNGSLKRPPPVMAIHQWPPYIEINDLKNFRREALSVSGRIDYNSYYD